MYKRNKLKSKIMMFEDKKWFIDLENNIVDIINTDGTRREALGKDGNLLDVMNEGHVISDDIALAALRRGTKDEEDVTVEVEIMLPKEELKKDKLQKNNLKSSSNSLTDKQKEEFKQIFSNITPEQRKKMKVFGKKLADATVDALNLKNIEEKEETEIVFIPTLHKGMKEFYSPKKNSIQNFFSGMTKKQIKKMGEFGKKLGQATMDALNLKK